MQRCSVGIQQDEKASREVGSAAGELLKKNPNTSAKENVMESLLAACMAECVCPQ